MLPDRAIGRLHGIGEAEGQALTSLFFISVRGVVDIEIGLREGNDRLRAHRALRLRMRSRSLSK